MGLVNEKDVALRRRREIERAIGEVSGGEEEEGGWEDEQWKRSSYLAPTSTSSSSFGGDGLVDDFVVLSLDKISSSLSSSKGFIFFDHPLS